MQPASQQPIHGPSLSSTGRCRSAAPRVSLPQPLPLPLLTCAARAAGEARPVIIAEVASTLSDMLYAQNKLDDAKGVVSQALDAAENAGELQVRRRLPGGCLPARLHACLEAGPAAGCGGHASLACTLRRPPAPPSAPCCAADPPPPPSLHPTRAPPAPRSCT
jgi:hypothetical protein